MVYIYVLKLEDNKYYVGKTTNPAFRIENHFSKNGSAWTRKYKPLKIEALIPDCDDYDEDKYTIKYMAKYGVDNVRGGSFVRVYLNEHERIVLNQMIIGTTNKCFKCTKMGQKGLKKNPITWGYIGLQEYFFMPYLWSFSSFFSRQIVL